MTPVFQYWIISGVSIALFIIIILYIHNLTDYFMYEFRNVLIASFTPALMLMIFWLLLNFPGRKSFSLKNLLFHFPFVYASFSIIVLILLGIAMAISNVSLIRHEGMSVKNVVGSALPFIWIVATNVAYALVCFLLAHSKELTGTGIPGFLSLFIPYFLYCLIDYGECMMFGIMIMGWVAAHGKSSYDKDFIIIPGCSIRKDGGLLPLLRGRVNRAIRYAWEQEAATGKPVYYIPSGGQGTDEIMSEGSAMEFYLLSHSAEPNEIFPEKKSTSTEENFLFSAQIVKEMNPDAKVAFATTNYHVLRCGMLAKRAGLIAEGISSNTKWYFWPNGFAREVVAIVSMTRKYHMIAVAVIFAASILITMVYL